MTLRLMATLNGWQRGICGDDVRQWWPCPGHAEDVGAPRSGR